MTEVNLPNFFYLLKEVLDVGLFCTTVAGTLLDANRAGFRMMGFEGRELWRGGLEGAEGYADPAPPRAIREEWERKGLV